MAGPRGHKGSPGEQRPRQGLPPWGLNRTPEHKLAGEASPGLVDSQAWAPRVWQAGGREHLPQGLVGAWPSRAPELELVGEASPGPVDFQAWAPQGTAVWRKGVPGSGPSGS
ncbi:hypothetical protein NDU88_001557 [Pleurodeles waltl]|uniref:Uncharacterized protein n=1 Tax=Pleurodeles waltl TaxID=8319 RepID=A0AAV7U8U1_PLEWA|nr:hypothetical protein NDU88_001557 [Pleurodeles waltl]